VLDDKNNRIQKFTNAGVFSQTIGSSGTGDGQFTSPSSLVISRAGQLVIADAGNARIQVLKMDGTFVSKFGSAGTSQGQFQNINTLLIENDGNLLVGDFVNNQQRIQRFTIQGQFISELNTGSSSFSALSIDVVSS
jgi:secreted PhoX family phosphatase